MTEFDLLRTQEEIIADAFRKRSESIAFAAVVEHEGVGAPREIE